MISPKIRCSPKTDVTKFRTDNDAALEYGRMLGEGLRKKSQFVDTAKFALRCGVCYQGLVGQKEALEHAAKTGHTNFQQTS